MAAEPVNQLSRALDVTGGLIDQLGPGAWPAATACTGWQVRDVVGHLISGHRAFTAIISGEEPGALGTAVRPPDSELAAAYRESASAMLGAFGQPGALDRVVTVPVGTVPGVVALHLRLTEALVHGWDIARATGLPAEFPADLAEQELAFTRSKLGDVPPGPGPFGPPQPVPGSAPAIDRLAALLGRPVPAPRAGSLA